MVELAYTATLKVAAERHTGSSPVIPSDHYLKSAGRNTLSVQVRSEARHY